MQIIRCDENIISKLPNVLELIYTIFGDKDIAVFATLDKEKRLGFVARVNEKCVYIDDNGEYTLFALNNSEELDRVKVEEYVAYMDELYFTDIGNKEYKLEMLPLYSPDADGYDGCISFKQYNPQTDTFCEINYQQMYYEINGKLPIYGFRTQEIDCVYIDEKYDKSKSYFKGLPLPKKIKFYSKVSFEERVIGYEWIKIKDYGLIEFLKNHNNICVDREREIRYVRASYVKLNGDYKDFWPFAHQMKREEVDEVIKSYGFLSEVPRVLLDIYNGSNYTVNKIKEIVSEMNKIRPILDTKEGANLGMMLSFR